MFDECLYCKLAEKCKCHDDEDACSKMLETAVDAARKEYYDAWFEYISDFVDY